MDANDWVSSKYVDETSNIRAFFRSARPFRHIVLNGFLKPQLARRLAFALRNEPMSRKDADLFCLSQSSDLSVARQPLLRAFQRFAASRACTDIVSSITGIRVRGAVDLSGFVYRSGDYLLPHDDRLSGRKVAFVLNLSEGFTRRDSGELELFSCRGAHPLRGVKRIVPSFNALTLFEVSPKSFHQVREVLSNRERWSIGGWFRG